MSRSPSRSKSPQASPRPTFGVSNPPPTALATSRNFPPPRFRKSCVGSADSTSSPDFTTRLLLGSFRTTKSPTPTIDTSMNTHRKNQEDSDSPTDSDEEA